MLVATGPGVLVTAGMGVFVAAGTGVFVAAGQAYRSPPVSACWLQAAAESACQPALEDGGDDECPAETGSTATTLNTNKAAIRITRGAVFMGLRPPSTDSRGGGLQATASETATTD